MLLTDRLVEKNHPRVETETPNDGGSSPLPSNLRTVLIKDKELVVPQY